MRAVVKYAKGNGNVELREVEEPGCGDDQLKLEVAYCGVCGTDLHVLHDTFRNFPPVILGHEFAGTVVETGRHVTRVKPGVRVTVLPASAVTCGQCIYCRSGNFVFCSERRGMGHGVNGAFARYVSVRHDQAYAVPDGFGLDEAALCEPFAAAVQAVCERTPVRLGDVALVSGPGPIGLMCLKLLVAEGIKTIVAGPSADAARLKTAIEIGAAAVVDLGVQDLMDVVRAETDGSGVDAALECAGHPSSVRNCLAALRPLGHYTQVGICGAPVETPIDTVFYKQLNVAGSVCYTAKTWDRMMRILGQGKVRLRDLISAKLPLEKWEEAFHLCLDKKAVKVLLSATY